MVAVTRSKTVKVDPVKTVKSPLQIQDATSEEPTPKKRKVLASSLPPPPIMNTKSTREILWKLRPSYKGNPKKFRENDHDFVKRCESLVSSNVLYIDQNFLQQVKDLKSYAIFKDMNKIDIRTVKLLQSDIGELNEKDQKLSNMLSLGVESEEFDQEFNKLYGFDIDEPTYDSIIEKE